MKRVAEVSAPTKCRSCDAPIIWATTARGKRMPLDAAQEHPARSVAFRIVGGIAEPVPAADLPMLAHTSHFATSPQAGQWRAKR